MTFYLNPTQAVNIPVLPFLNVKDFGAKGDGVADDTAAAVPASGISVVNPNGVDCTVYVEGTGITNVTIGGSGFSFTGTTGTFRVPAGATFQLNYTSTAPTWQWFGD